MCAGWPVPELQLLATPHPCILFVVNAASLHPVCFQGASVYALMLCQVLSAHPSICMSRSEGKRRQESPDVDDKGSSSCHPACATCALHAVQCGRAACVRCVWDAGAFFACVRKLRWCLCAQCFRAGGRQPHSSNMSVNRYSTSADARDRIHL